VGVAANEYSPGIGKSAAGAEAVPAPDRFATAAPWFHETAHALTGLDDFGPEDYREGLDVLLRAMDSDVNFTPMGREFGAGTIIGTLCARLHAQAGWKRQPECLQQAIRRPLIITGIPRTGTTALHKLLSLDPQFQGLEHWLADTPMPRPPRPQWENNPHYQATVAGLDAFFQAVPEMRAAHEMTAHEVDECLEVLKQSFTSNRFSSGWHVPSYDSWFQQQDERASYRRYADVLRLVGTGDQRRWLLKNPGHIAQLDVLLETFPDACIVQTHRDPVKALPSLCSVLAMAHKVLEGNGVRLSSIGRRECNYWSEAVERAAAVRERHSPRQFFDVDHRRFHSDPMQVVRELYGHFGLELDEQVTGTMRQWLDDHPANRLGEHRYTAAQFDLDPDEIRVAFRNYTQRFCA
jgi:hypothetical protein